MNMEIIRFTVFFPPLAPVCFVIFYFTFLTADFQSYILYVFPVIFSAN